MKPLRMLTIRFLHFRKFYYPSMLSNADKVQSNMPNLFPDGLDLLDISPVSYIDSIMNGELECSHSRP